jgi:hypothetical protein
MRLTRLYTGSDGETHFENQELHMTREGNRWQSDLMEATNFWFRETSGDYERSWHNPPCCQIVVIIAGELEIQTSDGSIRRFGPGNVILAEDTTGRGHTSRAVNKQRRKSIHVMLKT